MKRVLRVKFITDGLKKYIPEASVIFFLCFCIGTLCKKVDFDSSIELSWRAGDTIIPVLEIYQTCLHLPSEVQSPQHDY